MNFGDISIINNPAAGLRIVLDHVLKQARTMPMPAGGGGMPGMPGFQMPGLPGGPAAAPGMNVVQLGKAFMQGQQVEGQRHTFGPASVAEVWTSTKLRLPVLTTFTGDFGQQTCRCTPLGVEPNPSAFQIPPGYRSMISG